MSAITLLGSIHCHGSDARKLQQQVAGEKEAVDTKIRL
jgi:hypothetical protein